MKASADAVRSETKSDQHPTDARSRADRLECNAAYAVAFALVAIEDAELAVAEAVDARIIADALAQSTGD